MSQVLIVFESMYGNNQRVASAIAEGLRTHTTVDVVEVGEAPTTLPADLALLVVGGPNHATGLSTSASRASAAKRSGKPPVTGDRGLRQWFEELQPVGGDVSGVAYDTRLAKPRFLRWIDRASRGVDKRLRKRRFRVVVGPEHFFVTSEQGPLADGELDRARNWGEALTSYVGSPEHAS